MHQRLHFRKNVEQHNRFQHW